jgi:hypothetical protein
MGKYLKEYRLLKILLLTGGSTVGCLLVHLLVDRLFLNKNDIVTQCNSKHLPISELSHSDYINLSEKVVSTLHATASTLLSHYILFQKDMFHLKRNDANNNNNNKICLSFFNISDVYCSSTTFFLTAARTMSPSSFNVLGKSDKYSM